MTWTPDQVIELYLAVREEEREDKRQFEERSATRKSKMEVAENYLLGTMVERGEEQIKTKVGTAYKSPQMRCTMTDRHALLVMLLENLAEINLKCDTIDDLVSLASPLFDVFTNHVNKDWVKSQLDTGVAPPGIDVHTFVQCNIRKA